MPLGHALSPPPHDGKRGTRVAKLLVAANLAVAATLALLLYVDLDASRGAYEARARDTARDLAAMAQANIASELSHVDAVLGVTQDELAAAHAGAPGADQAIERVLRYHLRLLPGVEALRMADAEGRVRWGNDLPAGAPIDVSDRVYYALARAQPQQRLQVVGPVQSRVSGHWAMVLARPVTVGDRFDGVLYASVTVDHFQKLLERYEVEPGDAITLRALDLSLVARHAPGTGVPLAVGSTAVSPALHAALARDPASGVFSARTAIDRVERTTAYRRVDGFPLMVFAGLGNGRFFEPWREQVRMESLLGLVALLLFAGATALAWRAWTRESRSVRALAAQTHRVQTLLRIAGDGIHIIDRSGRLVAMSDSFVEMLGSTREKLMGRHVGSWDVNQDEARIAAWLARVKDGDRQRVEVQHRRDDGRIIDVELQLGVAEIEGQLLVFCSARDVTENKRLFASLEESAARIRELNAEQAAMLDNDVVGMVKLRDRVATWKNRALDRMFGYAPGELDGRSVRVLYPDDESFEALGAAAYPVLAAGRHYRTQLQMKHKDGHLMWIDLSGVRLSDGVSLWLMVDISAMKEAQARVEHIAFHDALTGLPNRLLLTDRMRQAIVVAGRMGTRVAVCYLDLDGFKQVNDVHGHDAGDALLAAIAGRLQGGLRANDTAARVGGDEFVLLLTMLPDDATWRDILERLVEAVRRPVRLPGGAEARVGTSIGVAVAPDDGMEPAQLLTLADHAMLAAKRAGKGRIERAG